MTGNDVYAGAVTLLGEETGKVSFYKNFAVGCLNQLLANSFRENNSILASGKQAELLTPPVLTDLAQEIPYDEMLVRECFPYGLGALLVAEDDKNKFNWLIFEFENRLKAYSRAEFRDVEEMC